MSTFLKISFITYFIFISLAASARAPDSSIATNLPLYLTGNWCLNKEVFEDDVSRKGEIWRFDENNNYTFNGLGEDPYQIKGNTIKMTHFTTLEVLEISAETMVAKAFSTYYFSKDKCSEETLQAIKLTRLNNAIIMNNIDEVKSLIKEGVDVSKKDTRSSIQSTPLMVAVRNENIPIIKLLLKQMPDLTVKNYVGKTALDYAKLSELQEIEELIKNAD
jgi:transcriptional regulator NrdR family protein